MWDIEVSASDLHVKISKKDVVDIHGRYITQYILNYSPKESLVKKLEENHPEALI